MKRILLLSILFFTSLFCRAQWINSFTVTPTYPTSSDTITIVVEAMFPSGGCEGFASINSTSGNKFLASAFHCLGMLTVICTDYDTLIIYPQAPGNYTLQYDLTIGGGMPCVHDGNSPVVDSVSFTVTGTNDLPVINATNEIRIYPNPSDGKFFFVNKDKSPGNVSIYSHLGQQIAVFTTESEKEAVELILSPGVYFAIFENEKSRYGTKLIITD